MGLTRIRVGNDEISRKDQEIIYGKMWVAMKINLCTQPLNGLL